MSEPAPQRSSSRLRAIVVGLAVLIPAVPILVAVFVLGGGGSGLSATTATSTTTALRLIPVGVPRPPPQPNLLLPPGPGALVALVQHATPMRSAPGGRVFAELSTRTTFGSPQAVWVAKLSGAWLGVISTVAGNNRLGWIPASDASLSRVNWELRASLSARTLTVLRAGKAVEHYSIAVGKPTAPTPTGRFAVTDRLNTGDPTGPYGCCILALSAEAPHAIEDWSGGNRIAIHSTPETSSIGHDVSHGCMRLTLPEGRWLLNHIPLGTPTLISS
jgi:lipoprotein-anchoring transpeptidase ErfK/SrfK